MLVSELSFNVRTADSSVIGALHIIIYFKFYIVITPYTLLLERYMTKNKCQQLFLQISIKILNRYFIIQLDQNSNVIGSQLQPLIICI